MTGDQVAVLEALLHDWGPGSAVAMLGATVWMVLTGRLVPRRVHDDAVAAERARGDDWRGVAATERARAEVAERQVDEVLTFVRRSPVREGQ